MLGDPISIPVSDRLGFPRGRGVVPASLAWAHLAGALSLACSGGEPTGARNPEPQPEISCSIPLDQVVDGGVGRDGIPALTDPRLVPASDPEADYLLPDDRVLGIRIGEELVAVPHNILWWHEIVNFNRGGLALAVTYCPLTGSSLVFDRSVAGGSEFGVSGLLFNNNLMMFDRTAEPSLWPQMSRGARCGPKTGDELELYPSVEISWQGWEALHPETKVVSGRTGFSRDYTRYPYGDYEELNNSVTLFPMPPIDGRRPPKERVLGIPLGGDGGIAFPFLELGRAGRQAVHTQVAEGPVVVLWQRSAEAAAAFFARAPGMELTFEVRDGRFVDRETGSEWDLSGTAIGGPLAGSRLEPLSDAFVAFWFAWASFQPETAIWLSQAPIGGS